jgi:hypothetical protein
MIFCPDTSPLQRLAPCGMFTRSVGGLLSVLLFAAGLVWVLLYPVMNVTTGELKCRGTFYDENALIARSSKPFIGASEVSQTVRLSRSNCYFVFTAGGLGCVFRS